MGHPQDRRAPPASVRKLFRHQMLNESVDAAAVNPTLGAQEGVEQQRALEGIAGARCMSGGGPESIGYRCELPTDESGAMTFLYQGAPMPSNC